MSILWGLLWMAAAALISALGFMLIDRHFPVESRRPQNDVAGFVYSAVGMVYAVLIAFVVLVVWQQYDRADENAAREASIIAEIYRDVGTLGPGTSDSIAQALRLYARTVVHEEWPLMTEGRASPKAEHALGEVWRILRNADYSPTDGTYAWYTEIIGRVNDLAAARQIRLHDSRFMVPPAMWFLLITGALAVVGLTFVFGTESRSVHLLLTGSLAATIAMVLYVVWALDHPFSGVIRVTPESFEQVVRNLGV